MRKSVSQFDCVGERQVRGPVKVPRSLHFPSNEDDRIGYNYMERCGSERRRGGLGERRRLWRSISSGLGRKQWCCSRSIVAGTSQQDQRQEERRRIKFHKSTDSTQPYHL